MANDTSTAAVANKSAAAPASRVTQRSASPPVDRPVALTADESSRLAELRAKRPNLTVLPPDVRTVDEEHEFRRLSKVAADADRQAALDSASPLARLSPQRRLDQLRGQSGEGADIERRRIEEIVRDEARVAVLTAMDKRVVEEDDELAMLQARVAEARAAGGFDPNGGAG